MWSALHSVRMMVEKAIMRTSTRQGRAIPPQTVTHAPRSVGQLWGYEKIGHVVPSFSAKLSSGFLFIDTAPLLEEEADLKALATVENLVDPF